MVSYELIRLVVPRPIRNALREPKRTLELWKLSLLFLLGLCPTHKVREDWEVKCHPVSSIAFQAHTNIEEFRQELSGFVRHCTPGMILLDIGSHYGVFTLAALKYGGHQSRVIAVDPSPTAQRIFVANLRLAAMTDRVRFIKAAVGAKIDTVAMLSTGAGGDNMLVASTSSRSDAVQIKLHTIPSIVEMTGQKPTHIKIDVEGYEDEVIAGGKTYLEVAKPKIYLELHSTMMRQAGKSPEKVLKSLLEMGYKKFERYGSEITIDEVLNLDICRLVVIPD